MTLSLFDQLISEGERGLLRLKDERAQEGLQLDFKEKADATRASFSDDDKRLFGKALSAFANSAGGLLIWGVDCRKGHDGIDCVQDLKPINNIAAFYSEAVRLSGALVMPRLEGIRIGKIASDSQPDSGYLLVDVERSERRPHRSEAKGDRQYYKRAGESSFPMEHYDIEDAFKRQTTPTLELDVRFIPRLRDGDYRVLQGSIELFLTNTSNVSARMPYLQERDIHGASPDWTGPPLITHGREGEWSTHTGDVAAVIHPGLSRTMAAYRLEFQWNGNCQISGKASAIWEFHSVCRFGCENISALEKAIQLDYRFLARWI